MDSQPLMGITCDPIIFLVKQHANYTYNILRLPNPSIEPSVSIPYCIKLAAE